MSYDYIIVGAGSAGCVLADRLSADGKTRVLLLEAGPTDKKQEVHIPAAFSKLFKTPLDWDYETEPQEHMAGRKLYWPRGKMLGGSSSINAMIYQRGNPLDYDRWANLGNAGWSYRDVLPYFKSLENYYGGASEYHGVDGPLCVNKLRSPNPLSKHFVRACKQVGLPLNDDFNGATQEGFGLYQVTQKGGQRHSAADAFLKPAMKRKNLKVETEAEVTRLLFEGMRCVGVAYRRKGKEETATAAKEVILSGGAINSPQLLLLSGVGDAAQLQALGIPVVKNLPGVGQNLQDHLALGVYYACKRKVTLAHAESVRHVATYLLRHRGPLTSNVGEAGGFTYLNPESPEPDLQFHFAPSYFIRHGFDNPAGDGYTIAPTLVQPKSVGYLKLRSADPSDKPIIDAKGLSDEADLACMVDGLKLARRIGQAKAFNRYRGAEFLPGESVQSDDELRDYVRTRVETLYHPVGTCKMGSDSMAVVDSRLRVYGLAGLRVVDASIMPTIINANTNVPAMMIAAKAADMILESKT